jgi:competence protein ComGC
MIIIQLAILLMSKIRRINCDGFSLVEMLLATGFSMVVMILSLSSVTNVTQVVNNVIENQAKYDELQLAAYVFNDNSRLSQYIGVTDKNGKVTNNHLKQCLTGKNSGCNQYDRGPQVISEFSFGFDGKGRCDPRDSSCPFEIATTYDLNCDSERCQVVTFLSRLLERYDPNANKIEAKRVERVTNPQLLFGLSEIRVECKTISSIDYRNRDSDCGSFTGGTPSANTVNAKDYIFVDANGKQTKCALGMNCKNNVIFNTSCDTGFKTIGAEAKCF